MTDKQWDYYKARQAGKATSISADKVESGFYWAKASKAGGRVPIAIWRDPKTGIFNCRVGTESNRKSISEEEAARKWTYIAENDIPRSDYDVAVKTGTWPDGTPTLAVEEAAPVAGSNLPSDPFERLQAEIADKMASAAEWMKAHPEAKTQTDADYATNLQRELAALNKRADALFVAEKEPHLAAGRAVDEKFRFRETVTKATTALKAIFGKFMAAEEAKQKAIAQKKFEEERAKAEAERKRIEAEREALMKNDPIAALTSPEPEMPELPLAPPPVKIQTGGGVGNRAGLKSVWIAEITDVDALFQEVKDVPAIREALQKIADATVRAHKGATKLAGVAVREERRAA